MVETIPQDVHLTGLGDSQIADTDNQDILGLTIREVDRLLSMPLLARPRDSWGSLRTGLPPLTAGVTWDDLQFDKDGERFKVSSIKSGREIGLIFPKGWHDVEPLEYDQRYVFAKSAEEYLRDGSGYGFDIASFKTTVEVFDCPPGESLVKAISRLDASARRVPAGLKLAGFEIPSKMIGVGGPVALCVLAFATWLYSSNAMRFRDEIDRSFPWLLTMDGYVAIASAFACTVVLPPTTCILLGWRVTSTAEEWSVVVVTALLSLGFGLLTVRAAGSWPASARSGPPG